jgi:hypothetical protein
MTEEEAKALGRRAVACKGFRPMRGMKDFDGRTWTPDLLWRWTDGVDLPDLRDPATLGCLLALYEETREMLTCPDPVYTMAAAWGLLHPRTVEALVAALEAAPCST